MYLLANAHGHEQVKYSSLTFVQSTPRPSISMTLAFPGNVPVVHDHDDESCDEPVGMNEPVGMDGPVEMDTTFTTDNAGAKSITHTSDESWAKAVTV